MAEPLDRADLANLVTQAEFARIIDCNRSYVAKLKKLGKLVLIKQEDGGELVDVQATHQVLADGADPTRWHLADWNRRQRELARNKGGGDSGKEPSKNKTFWEAKTRTQQADAELREIELAKERALLVDRAGVETAAFEFGRAVREAFMPLPARLAATLAGISDALEVRQLLEQEIRATLGSIRMPVVASGSGETLEASVEG
jgi:hypothetical protein